MRSIKIFSGDPRSWVTWILSLMYFCVVAWSLLSMKYAKVPLNGSILSTPDASNEGSRRVIHTFNDLRLKVKVQQHEGILSLNTSRGKLVGYEAIKDSLIKLDSHLKNILGAVFASTLCLLFVWLRSDRYGGAFHPISVASPLILSGLSIPLVSGCVACNLNSGILSFVTKWGLVCPHR